MLSNKELSNITGGVFKIAAAKWLTIGGIVCFVIGAVNGYLRPLGCKVK